MAQVSRSTGGATANALSKLPKGVPSISPNNFKTVLAPNENPTIVTGAVGHMAAKNRTTVATSSLRPAWKGRLARRQPAAGDLRMVMAIIKTITDIERIGDESEKIGRVTLLLDASQFPNMESLMQQIDSMGQAVLNMLHDALDAFVRMDVDAAIATARNDEDVDSRYVALLKELMQHMKADPQDVEELQCLIWVVRALERIGDHSKNICEYIIYLVRGKDVRHTTIDEIEQQVGS